MTSTYADALFVKLWSPLGNSINNLMELLAVDRTEEIEMANIIYEFIAMNAHRFSAPIMDAAIKLHEEIKKAEEISKCQI